VTSAITRSLCIGLAFLFMTALGCNKVSKKNYDKLKVGMAYEEVVSIIGSPDSCSEAFGTKTCLWGSEKKRIGVSFIGSKAVAFSSKGLR
jgi:outer membrane protein assembly factor BamE (lipoprotein component of BamABCDE complex)